MAQNLPEYQRNTQIEGGSQVPNFADAMNSYGQAQYSTMQMIGASAAQSASNAMAKKQGLEMGQTPHGDLFPPITDYDKQVTESYNAQSQATLGLQAQKMVSEADTQLASATRLSPELINKTQQQMAIGMQKILENAPSEVKSRLSTQFQTQLITQKAQYQTKMVGEDREDSKNRILAAIQNNNRQVYQFQMAGYPDAAKITMDSTNKMIADATSSHLIEPPYAETAKQTLNTTNKNAQAVREFLNAKANGKQVEWENDFAKKPPAGYSYDDWKSAMGAVQEQAGLINNLQSQSQAIAFSKMNQAIVQDPTHITDMMWQDAQQNMSPLQYQQAQLNYFKEMKKLNSDKNMSYSLTSGWSDPEVFPRATPEAKDGTFFNQLVPAHIQDQQKRGNPISESQAQLEVAMSAAGAVPGYVRILNAQLTSNDPIQIEKGLHAVDTLLANNKGQNLAGLSKEASAMTTLYPNLKRSNSPQDAAIQAHNMLFPATKQEEDANESAWKTFLSMNKAKNESDSTVGLRMAGLNNTNMRFAQTHGQGFIDLFQSYYNMFDHNAELAKEHLQNVVKQTYGTTNINGVKETTFLPLEKITNVPPDGVGYVQDDIYEQLDTQLKQAKKAFDEKKTDNYWALEARDNIDDIQKMKDESMFKLNVPSVPASPFGAPGDAKSEKLFRHAQGVPIKVTHFFRNGSNTTYNIVMVPSHELNLTSDPKNPVVGGWLYGIQDKQSFRFLTQDDLHGNLYPYRPNINKIQSQYNKYNGIKKNNYEMFTPKTQTPSGVQ